MNELLVESSQDFFLRKPRKNVKRNFWTNGKEFVKGFFSIVTGEYRIKSREITRVCPKEISERNT